MTLDPARLRDRLRSIVVPLGGAPGASRVDPLPASIVPKASGSADGVGLETALGGGWRERDGERAFVVRHRYDSDAPYGRMLVGDIADGLRKGIDGALLLGSAAARAPLVFFDLETTGLSGGAGTHAFLVGRGWFDDTGAFVTEQHLLIDFSSEGAMLRDVALDLVGAGALVTFNGKSFDGPVLETRYLFHRLAFPCADLPHLDVLHPARRFWGVALDSGCSLGALEQRLLGADRNGDVPGFEIPARYFQYIRTGDAAPLAGVFEHNRLDLLSLAGVTAHLLRLIVDGPDAVMDRHEALALARIYERAGDFERATRTFETALALASEVREPFSWRRNTDFRTTPAGARVEALRSLALLARRRRRFVDAADRWKQLLEVPGCPAHLVREATEALAIHHEHRERDLMAAKRFALLSLETGRGTARGDELRHRLARIERKLVSDLPSLFPSWP